MRYRETGEVHRDFHRTTNGTIAYLRQRYGQDFLDEVFRRAARDVYRSIRDDLLAGDPEQLVEHWTYFLDREGGDYALERDGDTVRLTVHRCPAVAYLASRGIEPDPAFCRQTIVVNEALAEGSPFEVTTDVLGGGRCVQTLRRKRYKD
jgi:predicted ArsR family transcriptional regulator